MESHVSCFRQLLLLARKGVFISTYMLYTVPGLGLCGPVLKTNQNTSAGDPKPGQNPSCADTRTQVKVNVTWRDSPVSSHLDPGRTFPLDQSLDLKQVPDTWESCSRGVV